MGITEFFFPNAKESNGNSATLSKEKEKAVEKPVEKKPEPKWTPGKSYHPQDFIKLIGIDDPVNKRMFTKGEFGQYREKLTKLLEDVAARKNQDQTFNREEAAKLSREYHSKSDSVSKTICQSN